MIGPDTKGNIIDRVGAGPCPKCGAPSRVMSGMYSSAAGFYTVEMFSSSDVETLLQLKQIATRAIKTGKTEEAIEQLKEAEPSWTNLWGGLKDEDPMVAIHLLWLLLAFLTFALSAYEILKDDTISDEQLRSEALKIFYESQNTNAQGASQKKNKLSQNKVPKKSTKKVQKSFYNSRKQRKRRPDS